MLLLRVSYCFKVSDVADYDFLVFHIRHSDFMQPRNITARSCSPRISCRVIFFQHVTGGEGVDLIVEMLANISLNTDLQLVAPHGRIGVRGCVTVDGWSFHVTVKTFSDL